MIVLVAVVTTLLIVALLAGAAGCFWMARQLLGRTADEQVAATVANRLMDALYVERVVVTLKNDEAFGGLLVDVDEHTINLREAFSLPSKDTVDGDLLIPRADVRYIQKP